MKATSFRINRALKEMEEEIVKRNRRTKEKYDKLIMDIGKSFREQIKG